MKIIFSFIFFYCFSISSSQANLLNQYCKKYNGSIRNSYQCPKSKIPLPIKTCTFKNKNGIEQFFNGCSGPSGGHSKLFSPACIKHDLCYHHEPISNGYGQSKCDYNFLQGMLDACSRTAKNLKACQKWARIMYRGVRIIGKPAFHCANYRALY